MPRSTHIVPEHGVVQHNGWAMKCSSCQVVFRIIPLCEETRRKDVNSACVCPYCGERSLQEASELDRLTEVQRAAQKGFNTLYGDSGKEPPQAIESPLS